MQAFIFDCSHPAVLEGNIIEQHSFFKICDKEMNPGRKPMIRKMVPPSIRVDPITGLRNPKIAEDFKRGTQIN